MQSNGWPSKWQVFCRVQWPLTYSTKGLVTYIKRGVGEGKEEEGKELRNHCSLGNFLSSSNFHSLLKKVQVDILSVPALAVLNDNVLSSNTKHKIQEQQGILGHEACI